MARPLASFEIDDAEGAGLLENVPSTSRMGHMRSFLPAWLGGTAAAATVAPQAFRPLPASDDPEQPFTTRKSAWCPEEEAGWASRLLFTWVGSLLSLGGAKTLEQEDLWDVAPRDAANTVSAAFQRRLEATADEINAPRGRVGAAMWASHGRAFAVAGAIKLFHDSVMFAGPFLLEILLKHVAAGGGAGRGLGLAVALAAAAVVETLSVNAYFHILFRICLHLKTELVDALYAKSLKISTAARAALGAGAVVNLQSNDAAKLWSLPQYLHMLWSGPLQILAVMALLIRVIHLIPALVGLAVTVALIPLSALVARALTRVRKRLVALTDQRVKLAGEVITGVKAIKLYAWEGPYRDRITDLREAELAEIRRAALIGTWNNILWQGGPILISLAAFYAYFACGYELTAAVAFPALSLFNLLRFPVMMFPTQLQNIVNAKVALDRIQRFLEADEMKQAPAAPPAPPGAPAVTVRNADFAWGPADGPVLQDINLEVLEGQLVIVVGEVGAGKSSLLAALLGEMARRRGTVSVAGAVAYTHQDPWIQNASLRDNILLGGTWDAGRYSATLEACALGPDLAVLPAGDATEIGEKGVNLSGGQRHRVALARAVYANADVYLLDDPLSAVDAHVGRHLFDRCVTGLLSSKTRILVTHQLQYLPAADVVVVLQGGRVVQKGSYADLTARGVDFHQFELHSGGGGDRGGEAAADAEGSENAEREAESEDMVIGATPHAPGVLRHDVLSDSAAELLDLQTTIGNAGSGGPHAAHAVDHSTLEDVDLDDADTDVNFSKSGAQAACEAAETSGAVTLPAASKPRTAAAAQLTKAEERAVGRVDRAVYLRYFAAWGPAFLVPSAVLALAVTERGLQAGQNWWLSVWTEAVAAAEAVLPTNSTVTANSTAPWGGAMIDNTGSSSAGALPTAGADAAQYMKVYFIIGIISLAFQITRAVVVVLGSVAAARRLHAALLATVLRLPMSFFDSQPTGRLLNRFTKDTEAVDTAIQSSVASFLNCAVSVLWSLVVVIAVTPAVAAALVPLALAYAAAQRRYIATSRELKRLDSLALSPIFSHFSETLAGLATLRAFRAQPRFAARDAALLDESNRCYWPAQCVNRWLSVRLELLGISVVFAAAASVSALVPVSAGLAGLAITSALNLTGLMNWMVRQTTELEVNMNAVERMVEYSDQEMYPQEAPAIVADHRPLPSWPSQGAISVQNLVVRYRPYLDPVLRGVSFDVAPRQKVGVVGRTGCGKSTLMLALYRIVEPAGGRIIIDGIDVSTIGLQDLRSRLALVPQDPVIFSGTVRSNLDPFGDAGDDSDLWGALDRAGLAPAVRALPAGLDASIAEGGGNLSAGQRQLLCMARALLRRARILILDEATSSIDTASDAAVQATIASSFADCTVLTIAHRLHTIINSDKILVLDAGKVAEFDTPSALLARPDSAFKALVDQASQQQQQR